MDTQKAEEIATHAGEVIKHGFIGIVKLAKFLAPVASTAVGIYGDSKAASELHKATTILNSIKTEDTTK